MGSWLSSYTVLAGGVRSSQLLQGQPDAGLPDALGIWLDVAAIDPAAAQQQGVTGHGMVGGSIARN